MRYIFIYFILLFSLLFFQPAETDAQAYKCKFETSTQECVPCQPATATDESQCFPNTNVCGGINACGSGSCDFGVIHTCESTLPPCSSPNSCIPEGACGNPVSGFECGGGTLTCCAPPGAPTSTPQPTTAPSFCETRYEPYNTPWRCISPGGAVQGGQDCNPDGSPMFDPNAPPNSFDNSCGCFAEQKNSCDLICCHSNSTVGVPGTTGVPPEDNSSLCTPEDSPLTDSGIKTPFGCLAFTDVPSGPAKASIVAISNWAVILVSGIAVLIILYAALQIATGSGDPKRIQAGKELLFSGLAGLFLVGIAITVLNFLGVKILGLNLLGFVL